MLVYDIRQARFDSLDVFTPTSTGQWRDVIKCGRLGAPPPRPWRDLYLDANCVVGPILADSDEVLNQRVVSPRGTYPIADMSQFAFRESCVNELSIPGESPEHLVKRISIARVQGD